MTGNVVTSQIDAFLYVVLSKIEKHVPYGKLFGTTEGITLYPGCRINLSRYNRIQLYIYYLLHIILLKYTFTATDVQTLIDLLNFNLAILYLHNLKKVKK
jgi:hypothetical protein